MMFKKVSVLVDNDSWILTYAKELVSILRLEGFECELCRKHSDVKNGDVCFFLGCTKIASPNLLNKNKYNMVVHESALPKGKGFAPVAWQILEGKNKVPVSLIAANAEVDSGDIWLSDVIELEGSELCDEWRCKQGQISIKLAVEFVTNFEKLKPKRQKGDSTFYARRSPQDSELDIDKSIKEQFPLLRTVDNANYPAHFYHNGCKYRVEVYKDE